MRVDIGGLLKQAETLADRGRPVPALRALERVRAEAEAPLQRLLATYNLGVVSWDKLGDGLAARQAFLEAASLDGPEYGTPPAKVLRANALEDLMLSALSFDELDEFAERLRALTPEAPILGGVPPWAHGMRERGAPWSDVLVGLAMNNYYRNDPALDRGRYGIAKSTYHLLLVYRKQLRLSREDWRLVLYEYCALSQRMAADFMKLRGGDADTDSPEEFLPVLVDTLPLVDEYLSIYTGDRAIAKVRRDTQTMIDNARGRWKALSRELPRLEPALDSIGVKPPVRCHRCGESLCDPFGACPACGSVSPIGFVGVTTSILSFGGALLAGGFAWHEMEGLSLWLRVPVALISAVVVLAFCGPIAFYLGLRWLGERGRGSAAPLYPPTVAPRSLPAFLAGNDMGIRRLFWTGPRCSRCNQPLEHIRPGEMVPPKGRLPCTTMKCIRCGDLVCELCQGFGFGMIGGCQSCGGTHFEAFGMWMYRD